jgi:hypothetical protein
MAQRRAQALREEKAWKLKCITTIQARAFFFSEILEKFNNIMEEF